jgi:hypothetical protein
MTATFRRSIRRIAPVLLALGLTLTPISSQPARAQGPNDPAAAPEGEGRGQGRPLDGYFGTAVLLGLALFIVGKSARR